MILYVTVTNCHTTWHGVTNQSHITKNIIENSRTMTLSYISITYSTYGLQDRLDLV